MHDPEGSSIGHFGPFGGRYVPEMIIPVLEELKEAYVHFRHDPSFQSELLTLQRWYCGRPTPLYYAENLTKKLKGCRLFFKMESLLHTGAHKINNALGQGLLARYMGKKGIVAETGAGQHGLAAATVAARFGLRCTVFMGSRDLQRQFPNVFYMRLLGATVIAVEEGSQTLKDAVNAALKYWIEHCSDTHYLIGSVLGPDPYPRIVRDFQSVIGKEVAEQIQEYKKPKPDILVACVGGGSNAMGLFHHFIDDDSVTLYGVEAGGKGPAAGSHAMRFSGQAAVGIAQGYKSYFIQDVYGRLLPTHSISAGLDYAGIGPEPAYYHDRGRIRFESASDTEVLHAVRVLSNTEGIIPALESAHAAAFAIRHAPSISSDRCMVVSISGRGDKDLFITAPLLMQEQWKAFLRQEIHREC